MQRHGDAARVQREVCRSREEDEGRQAFLQGLLPGQSVARYRTVAFQRHSTPLNTREDVEAMLEYNASLTSAIRPKGPTMSGCY